MFGYRPESTRRTFISVAVSLVVGLFGLVLWVAAAAVVHDEAMSPDSYANRHWWQ